MTYYSARSSSPRFDRGFKLNKVTKLMGIYVVVILSTVFMIKVLVYDSADAPDYSTSYRPHPRKLTILLSQPRSGSSWIGSLLNSHPGIFYVYEPLHPHYFRESTLHLTPEKFQEEILKSLCFCEFSDEVVAYGLTQHSTKVSSTMGIMGALKPSAEKLTRSCKESRYSVAKVLQLTDLNILTKLSKECEIDVIHLIRDPRASLKSRMETFNRFLSNEEEIEEFTTEIISNRSAAICSEVLMRSEGLDAMKNLVDSRTLYYEKVVKSPLEAAKKLFIELEMDWDPAVEERIYDSTHGSAGGGGYGTVKDTDSLLGGWRKDASQDFIHTVETSCSTMMERFRYSRMFPA